MPTGKFKDWTLEELELIWSYDGSDGKTTKFHAERMGIKYQTWYSLRSRLRNAGGPEKLYEMMQESKKRRYNQRHTRASDGKVEKNANKKPETLEDFLGRFYLVTQQKAGRDGGQAQYRVTIPPPLAEALLKIASNKKCRWEIKPNGILLVPVKEKS